MRFEFIVMLLLFGCGPGPNVRPNELPIQRSQFGSAWPFKVESGMLSCRRGDEVVFEANGRVYAINGLARGNLERKGYIDLDAIWLQDPTNPDPHMRVDIGPMIDRGLTLCGP